MSDLSVAQNAETRDLWKSLALAALPIGTLAQTQVGSPHSRLDAGDALCLIACIGCAWRASREQDRLSVITQSTLVGSCFFWFAPDDRIAFLALTFSALVILATGTRGETARSAWLWLALSAHGLWGIVILRIASPLIVPLETWLVGWTARLIGVQASVFGTRIDGADGWYIYVVEGCSSLHGISLNLLIWASSFSLMGVAVVRHHMVMFMASTLGFVLLNTVRVLLMTRSEKAYSYWHDGMGATVFGLALTGLALGSAAAATRRMAPRAT